jgi:pyrimidine deaminase RibD-like protein
MAAGRGLRRLREAGVERDLGVLGETASALYAAYRPKGGG